MKSSDVYVCYTVKHIYISLLKNFKAKSSNNIIIITDHIINYKYYAKILSELSIFKDVIIVDDVKLTEDFNCNLANFIFFPKKLIKFFDDVPQLSRGLNNNRYINKVYIFLDSPRTSQYLMFKGFEMVLVEDGLGLYSLDKFSFKDIIKFVLRIPKTKGKDKRIKCIEATNKDKLIKSLRNKAVTLDIEYLQNNLNSNEIDALYKIFFVNKNNISINNNFLLLTQPFSEDKFISESEKIDIYNRILKEFSKGYNIFIKPHPRELTDYKKSILFPFTEIERNFPIELMNLTQDIHFDTVVTINSSAIDFINFANERKKLGIDYDIRLLKGYHRAFLI